MILTCDDVDKIPYLVGEIFVMGASDDVLVLLEDKKTYLRMRSKSLRSKLLALRAS